MKVAKGRVVGRRDDVGRERLAAVATVAGGIGIVLASAVVGAAVCLAWLTRWATR